MVYRQTVNTISSASLHPAQRALGSRAVRSRRFALPLKRLGILPCSPFLRGAVSAAGSAPLRHVASQVLRTIWRKLECVLICQNLTNRNAHAMHGRFCLLDPGGYLLSRTVASQVPSAYEGLTSVFGMGTGGTLQLNHRKGVVFENTLKTA